MKTVYVAIILMMLIMTAGCSDKYHGSSSIDDFKSAADSIIDETQNGESSASGDESSPNSDIAEDKEQGFSDLYPNTDIFYELNLEDGKFYEIPRLSEEQEAAFIESNDCVEAFTARLESYGVLLDPDIISEDRFLSDVQYSFLPIFICHYQNFDFLYVRFSGYRGYYSGNLYVFENSLLKKYISDINQIDLDNAFRMIGENIWLVKINPGGGTGMGVEVKGWINLTKDDMPTELYYTSYYGTKNYRYGHDIDFWPYMEYNAVEEELYINEQNIPVLKVRWQKEVYVEKDTSNEDKLISLTTSGYAEHLIDTSVDWEQFKPFDLSCGELLDGLEAQLNELIRSGTDEEKHIAKQLVDNFATMPID